MASSTYVTTASGVLNGDDDEVSSLYGRGLGRAVRRQKRGDGRVK
jgi:hypothetical protein